jgi:hypothetical protein
MKAIFTRKEFALALACALAFGILSETAGAQVRADEHAIVMDSEPAVHAVRRCPHCGWIESKRQIASSVADPLSLGIYEYTLRMTDGSSRVFRETFPASWRVGARLTLIDGQDPALD